MSFTDQQETSLRALAEMVIQDTCDYCQRAFAWVLSQPGINVFCPSCGLAQVRPRPNEPKAPLVPQRENTSLAPARERAVMPPSVPATPAKEKAVTDATKNKQKRRHR